MKNPRLLCMAAVLGSLAGCATTPNNAPVYERAPGAKAVEVARPAANTNHTSHQAPAPHVAPVVVKPVDGRGYYTVKRGDTLIRIALDQGQHYRDIVAWNNLANPNDIKADQVLRVLPPDGEAQTSSVVSMPAQEAKATIPASTVANKTGPRGDKRPFSDSALADLQKPDVDSASVVATNTTAAGKPAETKPAAKPTEKTADGAVVAAAAPSSTAAIAPPLAEEEKISWMWPSEGKIVANFDEGKNKGVDIAGKIGQQVWAAGAGKVMYAGSGIRGYGNLVIVKHSNNLLSAYAHNKSILVKEGQSVNKGQAIAEMGNSDSEVVKLHFEIRQQGKPVDPAKFLPNR